MVYHRLILLLCHNRSESTIRVLPIEIIHMICKYLNHRKCRVGQWLPLPNAHYSAAQDIKILGTFDDYYALVYKVPGKNSKKHVIMLVLKKTNSSYYYKYFSAENFYFANGKLYYMAIHCQHKRTLSYRLFILDFRKALAVNSVKNLKQPQKLCFDEKFRTIVEIGYPYLDISSCSFKLINDECVIEITSKKFCTDNYDSQNRNSIDDFDVRRYKICDNKLKSVNDFGIYKREIYSKHNKLNSKFLKEYKLRTDKTNKLNFIMDINPGKSRLDSDLKVVKNVCILESKSKVNAKRVIFKDITSFLHKGNDLIIVSVGCISQITSVYGCDYTIRDYTICITHYDV